MMKPNQITRGKGMGGIPEWLEYLFAGTLGSLGAVFVTVFKSRSATRKLYIDDRAKFTAQILERLDMVERLRQEERDYLVAKMQVMQESYDTRLKHQDAVIIEQNERIAQLENLVPRAD